MKEEDIVEANTQIAEFMGYTRIAPPQKPWKLNGGNHMDWELRYHDSWDWLMPVLEKICRMKIGDGIETVDYAYPRTFGMLDEDGKIMVRLNGFSVHAADTLIMATFESVVEFIEHTLSQYKSKG